MTTAKPTAHGLYRQRYQDIFTLLQWISDELDEHRQEAQRDQKNWGHAGSLGHVREKLMETLAFLSNSETAEIEEALDDARAAQ